MRLSRVWFNFCKKKKTPKKPHSLQTSELSPWTCLLQWLLQKLLSIRLVGVPPGVSTCMEHTHTHIHAHTGSEWNLWTHFSSHFRVVAVTRERTVALILTGKLVTAWCFLCLFFCCTFAFNLYPFMGLTMPGWFIPVNHKVTLLICHTASIFKRKQADSF